MDEKKEKSGRTVSECIENFQEIRKENGFVKGPSNDMESVRLRTWAQDVTWLGSCVTLRNVNSTMIVWQVATVTTWLLNASVTGNCSLVNDTFVLLG
jgi:hypothetical protein